MNNLIRHIIFLLAVLMLQSQLISATAKEETSISLSISSIMEQVRNNEETIWMSDAQLKMADPQVVLSTLAPYEKDSNWTVRQMACLHEVRLARLQPVPEVRQEVTKRLVGVIVDPNLYWSPQPYEWLLTFKAGDFDPAAETLIRQNLLNENIKQRRLVLVLGVANITEELPRLKELLIDELAYQTEADKTGEKKWYYTLGWHARLARARMGIEADIEECINLIEQEINSNNNFRLLHDLGYIRQPIAIESLKKYFLSNLRLPPTNPGMEGEPYSQYIMPILEDNLSDFPIRKSESHKLGRIYSKGEIELCKEWMSEQTTWQIIR